MPREASPRDSKEERREHRESRDGKESKETKSPETTKRTRKRKSLWDEGAPTQGKKEAPSTNDPSSLSPATLQSQLAAGLLPIANPALNLSMASSTALSPMMVASPLLQNASSPVSNQLALQQQALIQQQLLQAKNIPQVSTAEISNMANSAEIHAFACRIYIGSLFYELTEADLLLAFSPFGPISKIDMPKDPSTGRHKGFCFIDYVSPQSAALALSTMNDFSIGGRKIKVGRPNNVPLALQASVAQLGLINPLAQKAPAHTFPATQNQNSTLVTNLVNTRIYVGSINYDIVEKDIEAVFSAFGLIKSCQLIPNTETGKHKGYGFIEYVTEESAKASILAMNGFELGGRQIKVGWASTSPGNPGFPFGQMTQPLMPTFAQPLIQPVFDQKQELIEKKPENSRVLLLNNMVSAEEIDDELQNEVTEECGKYGQVDKVVIYQGEIPAGSNDSGVKIFVLFSSPQNALSAQKSLDRRWFGGRLVVAKCYDEGLFFSEDYSK